MTWTKPQVTIPNAQIAGETVTGTFVFPSDVVVEIETRTQEFFQSDGTTSVVASTILEWYGELSDQDIDGDGLRQELSLDIGGGIHAITIDFLGYTGSPHQWGNTGAGGTPADATGEDVHAQMAVFDRYLQTATIDSKNPATLEFGEYSSDSSTRYGPLQVIPENPNIVFNSPEESSVFDGSVTWIETISLDQALDTGGQEDR
jgi:hypothetical protein